MFFVSDQTGVTAETLGHSLMTQFEGLEYRSITLPFVSSLDKAQEAARRIDRAAVEDGLRPIVFSTMVQDELRDVVLPDLLEGNDVCVQKKPPPAACSALRAVENCPSTDCNRGSRRGPTNRFLRLRPDGRDR